MKFFLDENNVDKYLEMVTDYDPSFMVQQVRNYASDGSTLLELGMGGGTDLVALSNYYQVVGSDYSLLFIEKFQKRYPQIRTELVDAIQMNISGTFDCIYSNKVLQHLTRKDFITSLQNQKKHLNKDGIIFMTLWRGEHKEEMMYDESIRFTYYLEEDILNIVADNYEVMSLETYDELEVDDSLLVVLKVK